MPASRRYAATSILCAALGTALLAAAPATAADSICDSIRAVARLVPDGFASLQRDSDGETKTMLAGASNCTIEEGEYSCTWSPVSEPGKRAAALGKEIAACFPGSNLAPMEMLAIHLIKTDTATITVIGALEDKLVLVTIK